MKKLGLFLLLFCLITKPAQAFSVTHQFDVEIGPFDASRAEFSYLLTTTNFKITSAVKTFGLFKSLYPFQADYETSGRIEKEALITQDYSYRSQSRFNQRTKKLVYDQAGNILYRLSSKNGKEKKKSVPQDDKNANTTDLQSVFAELIKQYNKLHFCDSRMEVFDGKRRFDVIFADQGKENLPKLEKSPFFGEAIKCSMYIDRLNNDDDDLLMQISVDRPIYFWLMEQNNKAFIARIHIEDTPLGALNAVTTNVTFEE